MLDQRRVAAQPDENREQAFREQLFAERYERLHAWALQLTHEAHAADDLVHDAFVQWVLSRTRLEEIENIDGYLRNMLRNMHLSRLSQSAQRLHETTLSIADYDSCRLGWMAIEPPRRMQACEDLHKICAYACSRKESSKAGSVLILRFFHNYFPSEIAGVLHSSRNCVDQFQRLARREAKLFMDRPGGLRFVNGPAQAGDHPVRYLTSESDLMLDLRELIFSSCHGDCLTTQELDEVYTAGRDEALTTTKLAHIVSCPKCLDAVNGRLGLPLLAERYSKPEEPKDPPNDPAGGGTAGGGPTDLGKKLAHRLRETREHKPQELRIAVNGFVVSTLKISSDLSEFDLNLSTDDAVEFVQLTSEQGLQLLFFSVDPSGPQGEQWAWIELSEGRYLEACYQSEPGPSLHVVYQDPSPDEAHVSAETSELSSPLTVISDRDVLHESNVGTRRGVFGLRAWARWFARLISTSRVRTQRLSVDSETDRTAGEIERPLLLGLLHEPSDSDRAHSRLRVALIVLACIAVVGGFLFFKARLSRVLSANALLARASIVERAANATPDRVSHRIINLEERRSAEGAVVARRTIEIWQNHANGNIAFRLYDDSNRVIAGMWQKQDGSRIVLHHGSKPRPEPGTATPDNLLLNPDDVWQIEPLAQSFVTLLAEPGAAQVEERSTTYVVHSQIQRSIGATNLLQATLTLSKSDLHAVEQTLLVQRGGEIREYRFVEAVFELLPLRAVAPAVFEIEPELRGGAGEPGRPGDWALRDLTSSRVPPSPSTSAPPSASAELEVDVAYLLNQAKADRNEQVTLTRSAGGSLRVEGVVDTQQRKDEFLRTLAPVSNNPAVKIEIRTVAEAVQRPAELSSAPVQELEETASTIAADEELRAFFERRNPSGQTDEAIREYSSRVVNRAYSALFHAIELKRLVSRFAGVDMRTVAPDARSKWLSMLREHASAFERETAALRQDIQPVFFAGTAAQVTAEDSIQSDSDLARAVERLHKSALSNNDAIRSAFTISRQTSAAAVKSGAFWQSILRAEQIARRIEQYQAASAN